MWASSPEGTLTSPHAHEATLACLPAATAHVWIFSCVAIKSLQRTKVTKECYMGFPKMRGIFGGSL